MASRAMERLDANLPGRQRRTSFEVMTELLAVARNQTRKGLQTDGGVSISKRQLMRSANLNHTQLTDYLDALDQRDLVSVEETDQGMTLVITNRGEEFLDRVDALVTLFEE